jgi:hypothetical protein
MAKKKTAYVYARVSTKTNKDKAGLTRQLEAARADAHRRALRVTASVCEVVSGTLPANQRTIFHELLDKAQKNGVKEVIMENGRTLARDVVVSESLRQAAQARGIRLRSSDMQTMFDNNPNPTQRFQDWVQMGYFQLEKDLAVERMVHGFAEKKINVRHVKDIGEHGNVAALQLSTSSRTKKVLSLLVTMATGATSGTAALVVRADVGKCPAVAVQRDYSTNMLVMAVLFLLGLAFGVVLTCRCMRPAPVATRTCAATLDKQSQAQTTYTWKATEPRFKPLAESSHG